MNDAVRVRKTQATQQLVHEVLEVRILQRLRALNNAVQVAVHVLHHQVQLIIIQVYHQVLERDDVWVLAQPAARGERQRKE